MRAPPSRSARVDPLEQEIEDPFRPGHFIEYGAGLSNFEAATGCYERAGLNAKWESLVREVRAEHYRKTGFMSGFEAVVAGAGSSAKPTFLERAKVRWPRSSES